MADRIMPCIAQFYRSRHDLVLNLLDRLDDRQVTWTPNKTTPPIAFHVWHLARWADYLQEALTGSGVQLWEQEELAARWGLDAANLGFAETGLEMADEGVGALTFPNKDILLDYAHRAFALANQAVAEIGDDQFLHRARDPHGAMGDECTIGDMIMNLLVHAGRHLGMIECLLGVLGLHGTATR